MSVPPRSVVGNPRQYILPQGEVLPVAIYDTEWPETPEPISTDDYPSLYPDDFTPVNPLLPGDQPPSFASALCAQTDPELFLPGKGASTVAAKRVCARCPKDTKSDCLEYALDHYEPFGIWGGLSERERRIERHRRDRLVAQSNSGSSELEHEATVFPTPTLPIRKDIVDADLHS